MIGSLLYIIANRPDISFSVGLYAKFQSLLKEPHLSVVKRIVRYLKNTSNLKIWYYHDSNWKAVTDTHEFGKRACET